MGSASCRTIVAHSVSIKLIVSCALMANDLGYQDTVLGRMLADTASYDFYVHVVGDEKYAAASIGVHKAVLMQVSDTFKNMLSAPMQEGQSGMVEFDTDLTTARLFVTFMYTGVLGSGARSIDGIEPKVLFDMEYLADYWQVQRCLQIVRDHVESRLALAVSNLGEGSVADNDCETIESILDLAGERLQGNRGAWRRRLSNLFAVQVCRHNMLEKMYHEDKLPETLKALCNGIFEHTDDFCHKNAERLSSWEYRPSENWRAENWARWEQDLSKALQAWLKTLPRQAALFEDAAAQFYSTFGWQSRQPSMDEKLEHVISTSISDKRQQPRFRLRDGIISLYHRTW